jgi:hypothetical protein
MKNFKSKKIQKLTQSDHIINRQLKKDLFNQILITLLLVCVSLLFLSLTSNLSEIYNNLYVNI